MKVLGLVRPAPLAGVLCSLLRWSPPPPHCCCACPVNPPVPCPPLLFPPLPHDSAPAPPQTLSQTTCHELRP
ncbi:hypothetical protein HaLaN_00611 [Haematococcus lacustris]|uniref:Secreted protein n=1 Tax=Haematococcus lacustris TaxID=44745 RepID=A0A699Y7C8_HAELA|nr:hypothetical protein HaLaN_00611 [Haematococcus lacustris]